MADSNRELILKSLKATLENILESKGFDNNVTNVYRKMVTYDGLSVSLPVLMLLGAGEVYEDTLGPHTMSRFTVKIRGYSRDEAHPEEALNSLIRDVQSVLENKTYNVYHSSFKPVSLDTDEGWLSAEVNGLALFEMIIEIGFKFSRLIP